MQRRLILLSFVSSLLVTPAEAATWIYQQPSDTVPSGMWISDSAPIAGTNLPANSKVGNWTIVNGDTYPGHYIINADGSTSYWTPPAPPAPGPDPKGFKLAVLSDSTIAAAEKIELIKFLGLADNYGLDPSGAKAAWALISQGDANLSPTTITTVQNWAVQFRMPLQ